MSRSRSKSKARQEQEEWVVEPGTEVYDDAGKKIGGVTDIQGGDLIVHKGGMFAKDYRIPFSAVATHTDERIDLSMSADEATGEGQRPADEFATTSSTDEQLVARDEHQTASGTTSDGVDNAIETSTEVIRVPVVEEQLDPSLHQVERGEVRLETVVTEREESLDVPVTEERVRVQRVAVDRLATAADLAVDGRTLSVAVYGEEVDLSTQSRVVEEVVISKDAIQETREVTGTVRREDVEVIDDTLTREEMTTGTTSPTTTPDKALPS